MSEKTEARHFMTRKEYLDAGRGDPQARAEAHRAYYGQFVCESTIERVARRIGREALLRSTDPNLNDIPLRQWDVLAQSLPVSAKFEAAGDSYALSSGVCLAKEAARQYIERERAKETA